jgi:hypothetical protein
MRERERSSSRHTRAGIHDSKGTSLAEVLIVLTLMAAVATPLFMVLQSGFRTERAQSDQFDLDMQLALVVDRFETDIRTGLPAADSVVGSPSQQLALSASLDDGSQRLVVWSLDVDDLRRRAVDPTSGAVVSDVVLIEDVAPTGPIFRYWDEDGGEISPSAVTRIMDCSVRVTVDLVALRGSATSTRVLDVAHRSQREQEVTSC